MAAPRLSNSSSLKPVTVSLISRQACAAILHLTVGANDSLPRVGVRGKNDWRARPFHDEMIRGRSPPADRPSEVMPHAGCNLPAEKGVMLAEGGTPGPVARAFQQLPCRLAGQLFSPRPQP